MCAVCTACSRATIISALTALVAVLLTAIGLDMPSLWGWLAALVTVVIGDVVVGRVPAFRERDVLRHLRVLAAETGARVLILGGAFIVLVTTREPPTLWIVAIAAICGGIATFGCPTGVAVELRVVSGVCTLVVVLLPWLALPLAFTLDVDPVVFATSLVVAGYALVSTLAVQAIRIAAVRRSLQGGTQSRGAT